MDKVLNHYLEILKITTYLGEALDKATNNNTDRIQATVLTFVAICLSADPDISDEKMHRFLDGAIKLLRANQATLNNETLQ